MFRSSTAADWSASSRSAISSACRPRRRPAYSRRRRGGDRIGLPPASGAPLLELRQDVLHDGVVLEPVLRHVLAVAGLLEPTVRHLVEDREVVVQPHAAVLQLAHGGEPALGA